MNSIYKQYRKLNLPSGSLRISITDDCNMRCYYCHNEGQINNSQVHYMDIEEIRFILNNAMDYGLQKVRLTGGEPLLHPQIDKIIEMIFQELHICNIGVNTNGILLQKLEVPLENKYLRQVVIGMDYFNGAVSKYSPIGLSSETIRKKILMFSREYSSAKFFIDYVFTQNIEDLLKMTNWCLVNGISLRVLEKVDLFQKDYSKEAFDSLCTLIKYNFNLCEGIVVDLNERYLFNSQGTVIIFYQSHCNRTECHLCRNIHMRITATGFAKPCLYQKEALFPLLDGDFSYNMNRAIINSGKLPTDQIL